MLLLLAACDAAGFLKIEEVHFEDAPDTDTDEDEDTAVPDEPGYEAPVEPWPLDETGAWVERPACEPEDDEVPAYNWIVTASGSDPAIVIRGFHLFADGLWRPSNGDASQDSIDPTLFWLVAAGTHAYDCTAWEWVP
jgi:hypothetical protein